MDWDITARHNCLQIDLQNARIALLCPPAPRAFPQNRTPRPLGAPLTKPRPHAISSDACPTTSLASLSPHADQGASLLLATQSSFLTLAPDLSKESGQWAAVHHAAPRL
eukprot:364950-Chlamydomonas_euryale.AAC.9